MIENYRTEFEQIMDQYLRNLTVIVGVGGFATCFALLSLPSEFSFFSFIVYAVLAYQLGGRYRAALKKYGKADWCIVLYMLTRSWLVYVSLIFMCLIG